MSEKVPTQPADQAMKPKIPLEVHPEYRQAVDMLNSIKVLGPDLKPNEERTRAVRQREFDKIKHVLEDYGLCAETGKIIRIR